MKKLLFATLLCFLSSGWAYSQVYLQEDFNSGIPGTWNVVDGGSSLDTWTGTTNGGTNLDGTSMAFVDSDAAGNNPGIRMDEQLVSTSLNTGSPPLLLLEFDHFYRDVFLSDSAWVEVFDGNNWVTVGSWNTTVGSFGAPVHETIDITPYSNSGLRVNFHYDDDSTWGWWWAVDNVKIWAPFADDAAAVEVPNPVRNGCNFTSTEPVTLIWVNNGTDTLSNIDLTWEINGGSQSAYEFFAGPVLPGDTVTYTFTGTADLSLPGTYNFDVYTELGTDQDMSNDTISFTVENSVPVSSYPYFEDFELGAGNWVSGGTTPTWAFGTPAKTVIQGAASGDSAWVTGGLGQGFYFNDEQSWLESPCFDFGSLSNPVIEFDIWWESENGFDGTVLQSSTDNGQTWQQVGTVGTPINWYNNGTVFGLPNQEGWSGTLGNFGSAGWVGAKNVMNALGGQPSVKFRFFFGSDGSVTGDGVALDNIFIYEQPPFDAALIGITSPATGCGLGNTEVVSCEIFNNGSDTLTNIPVHFTVNGGTPVNEIFAGPVFPGDTGSYTFTGTANLAAGGLYNITVYTTHPGDSFPQNDSGMVMIENFIPLTTFPYYEDFETGRNGWRVEGLNSTWAFGTPAKNVIIGAASGDSAWVTGGLATAPYSNNEASYVESPCMDISTVTNPWVSLAAWWDSESGFDGAVLEATTDDGATWTRIGDFGDPFNWYNDNGVAGLPGQQGWSGGVGTSTGSGAWVQAQHDLSAFAGSPSISFRVFFGSDGSVTQDGFAFDNFAIGTPPVVSLGNDTTLCASPYTLDATLSGVSYLWSTGDSTASIDVTTSGSYSVVVTDSMGFQATDTVSVTINASNPQITGDTIFCSNDTANLAVGSGFTSYNWSTGSTTATTFVNSPGPVSVTVTNAAGCSNSDTIDVVMLTSPQPNVSQNPAFCTGDTLTLSTDNTWPSWSWTTGSTTQSTQVSTPGTVTVTVTDSNNCTGSFTANVIENPLPVVDLGNDTVICNGNAITLSGDDPNANYLWSTGATTTSIQVTLAGDYILQCTDVNGCVGVDTINVTAFVSPSANFNFDTTACPQVSFSDQSVGNPTSWSWDFGDGSGTSSVSSPSYTYSSGGQFNVVLTVDNQCGSNQLTKLVEITCLPNGIEDEILGRIALYPNPNQGTFQLAFEGLNANEVSLQVIDLSGKVLAELPVQQTHGSFVQTVNLPEMSAGVYYLVIEADGVRRLMRFFRN